MMSDGTFSQVGAILYLCNPSSGWAWFSVFAKVILLHFPVFNFYSQRIRL